MQKINTLFSTHPSICSLVEQASALTTLQKIWHVVVPENFRPYTQAGNIQHKRLTVYADNGAIAAKIKLMLPTLLSNIQKQGVEVTSIRVQVQVQSLTSKRIRSPRVVSKNGAINLLALSKQLAGSQLGEILEKIASHNR